MIRLTDVAKEYPRSGTALAQVSFQVRKGEFVFLTGPSGSGKTTILKLLYMDDKPNQGEVWVNGVSSLTARGREISRLRRRLGIVFQDFRLLEDRTAEENVRFALEVTGAPKATIGAKVSRALTQVGPASQATSNPQSPPPAPTIHSTGPPTSPRAPWPSARHGESFSCCGISIHREPQSSW